jgi:curli biogenesis system outer membrane secretion channel CsgG
MRKTLAVFLFLTAYGLTFAGTKDEMVSDAVRQIAPTLSRVPAEVKRVAVSTIEVSSNSGIDVNSLQDQIGEQLLNSGRFQLIDRKSLKTLLDEQKLSLIGMVDPVSMAKAGKLIGVQGFFFGSIESSADKVILNLKLVDADTGAISYSQKFLGVPQSFIALGVGAIYSGMNVSLNGATAVNLPSFGGILSYKQGFQGIPFGYLGFDLGLQKTFGSDPATEIRRMDLRPKIYFSPRPFFNWELDYVDLYLGVDFSMMLAPTATEPSAFGIYPVLGLELNMIRFISIFAEGQYVYNTALNKSTVSVTGPLSFCAGLRFFWYIY